VCVDHTVKDRLVSEWGIPERRVQVLLNFVDLSAFRPRSPLPARPARALIFSNNAAAHLHTIRKACDSHGIAVDAVGRSVDNVAERPENILGEYDVVFAKARCALEAMAVGTAVILCDEAGMGPMVTSGDFDRLRSFNFGVRTLREPVTAAGIGRELSRYDPSDAADVSRRMRASAGLEEAVDALLEVYEDVLSEWRHAEHVCVHDELRSAAAYLATLKKNSNLKVHTNGLLKELYLRAERFGALRRFLPSRAFARRFSSWIRRT
jgi:hypothetical protein